MNNEKIQNSTSSNEVYTKEEFLKRFSKGTPTYSRESSFENKEPKTYSIDNRKSKSYSEKSYNRGYGTSYSRSRQSRNTRTYGKASQGDNAFFKAVICAGIVVLGIIVKTVDISSFNYIEEQLSAKLSEVVTMDKYLNKEDDLENLDGEVETIEFSDKPIIEDVSLDSETTTKTITELKSMTDFEVEEGLFGEKK